MDDVMDNLNFGNVLEGLKLGKKYARKGWNNANIFIELQVPDENSKMTLPYIFMTKLDNKFPCDLSCESILANDWAEYNAA